MVVFVLNHFSGLFRPINRAQTARALCIAMTNAFTWQAIYVKYWPKHQQHSQWQCTHTPLHSEHCGHLSTVRRPYNGRQRTAHRVDWWQNYRKFVLCSKFIKWMINKYQIFEIHLVCQMSTWMPAKRPISQCRRLFYGTKWTTNLLLAAYKDTLPARIARRNSVYRISLLSSGLTIHGRQPRPMIIIFIWQINDTFTSVQKNLSCEKWFWCRWLGVWLLLGMCAHCVRAENHMVDWINGII